MSTYCHACGGDGWLPSRPEGESTCHYCGGTGRDDAPTLARRALDDLDDVLANDPDWEEGDDHDQR